MYCRNCGTENRDDAKFCKKCGLELDKQQVTSKKKEGSRPRRIIPIIAAIAVLVAGACAFAFQWAKSRAADAEYEDYLAVQESVQGIEAGYRNQAGYHDPERIPDLLEEVENYGLDNTDLVTSVDRGDDYVEFRLADGTLYVFMPTLEGILSGGVDCSIITLEPWWTDVEGVDSLRLDGDDLEIDGFTEVSGFDIWANAVPAAIDEYAFSSNDNVNDSDVTLDRLRTIGRNQFVFYFGHGGAPTKSHGSFLTTGEATTEESRERHKDDLEADRLVQTSSGRLAVTDKFFDSGNFGDDAFSNTDFFLLACHSCQDTQLADALLGKGARTVTGFTETVTVKYGAEMVYGILGLNDDAKGLTDVGKDGKYLTFAESISNAQSVYGGSDPYLEFKWYETKHDPAEVACYPADASRRERLSDTLVAYLDGDKDAAAEFIKTWYNDWTFENGHDVQNTQPLILRCPPLIAEDSVLFDEFVESCNSMTGKYSRDFASCVVSTPQVEELDGDVFRVTVRFIGVQNTVDQAMYDRLIANPSEDVWDVKVDKDNKVTSLTRVDDNSSSVGNEQAAGTSGMTQDGTYILSGSVHVHAEDFGGQRTDSVVSIVLDEDVPYEYEYKGTVQAVAHDVLLATTGTETFGADRYDEWAQYDGQHITVECDGLQGANHDASYWNVDTLATGKIWLLNSSSQATFHVEDYYKQIERQSKESVVYSTTGDFDGDDSKEAFVVTGSHVNDNHTWTNAEVWFVSSSGMVSKAAGEETFPAQLWYKGYEPSLGWWDNREYPPTYYGFFCVEATGGGPTSTSHAYGVRDGKAVEATFDVEYIGDVHYEESTRKIVGSASVSLSPRRWQKYGFDFDPDAFAFKCIETIGDPV